MKSHRIALMCAERDPLTCHRAILVCRHLRKERDLSILHILDDGQTEPHEESERRLLKLALMEQADLFKSFHEQLEEAYDHQGLRIAYRKQPMEESGNCMKTHRKDLEMKLYTIGFTRKSAETFFTHLKQSGVRTLIDTRLNNRSQLSGFAKQNDLQYFLREIGKIDYPAPAPPRAHPGHPRRLQEKKGPWEAYERSFLTLMLSRKIEEEFQPELFDNACLLCSEHKPHHCHRRLVAEYLRAKWGRDQNRYRTSPTTGPCLIRRPVPLLAGTSTGYCSPKRNSSPVLRKINESSAWPQLRHFSHRSGSKFDPSNAVCNPADTTSSRLISSAGNSRPTAPTVSSMCAGTSAPEMMHVTSGCDSTHACET